MKAEINKDGYIHITAENIAEAFALQYITDHVDPRCNPQIILPDSPPPVVIDYSILDS